MIEFGGYREALKVARGLDTKWHFNRRFLKQLIWFFLDVFPACRLNKTFVIEKSKTEMI